MANITITIPDEILDEFKEKFFYINQKPDSFEGSDAEWVKQKVRDFLNREYRDGKARMNEEEIINDN